MPFVVVCPECNAQLKSSALVPAGRTITCPSCKTKFTTEKDSKEVGGTSSKASVSVPPAPPPSKPKPKPVREEEADFEDDDERPAKKKLKATRDDDDDFEDEERPSKKKTKPTRNEDFDDDDEDERPAKKKASKNRDDDDENEDRPRSKKGKKSKPQKSNLPLLLGIGGGGFLLLIVAVLVLFLTDTFPFNKKDGPKFVNNPPGGNPPGTPLVVADKTFAELIKYAPSTTNTWNYYDIETLRNDPVLSKIATEAATVITTFNPPDDIHKIGVFGHTQRNEEQVIVVRLKQTFNRASLEKTFVANKTTINNITAYFVLEGVWYFPDDYTIVMGTKETIQKVAGQSFPISPAAENASRKITGAISTGGFNNNGGGIYDGVLESLEGYKGNVRANPSTWIFNASLKQSTVEITESIEFTNDQSATSCHQTLVSRQNSLRPRLDQLLPNWKQLNGAISITRADVKMMLETVKVTKSGNNITVTYSIPKSTTLLLVRD